MGVHQFFGDPGGSKDILILKKILKHIEKHRMGPGFWEH
jgi:hypothetical protein